MGSKLSTIWEQRLSEQEGSGKSIAAWCKEQAIKESQFYYWRKKLRADKAEKTQPVQWLPLDSQLTKQVSLVNDTIAIHIGKVKVDIHKGFDRQLLREIVQVLQMI